MAACGSIPAGAPAPGPRTRGIHMDLIIKGLIGLSALAFLLAVCGSLFAGEMAGASPEAFSRASTNLALIAIALAVTANPLTPRS